MSARIHHDYIAPASSPNGTNAQKPLQESEQGWFARYFTPQPETQVMPEQSARGVFIPWPLLAIIVTLAIVLVSGLVTLEVQVSNLSTTLLLRDADQARRIEEIKSDLAKESEKRELTDLKVADLRERQIRQEPRKN